MSILHIHRNQILYLEQAKVYVFEDRVVYSQTEQGVEKTWNIPELNLSCLILGTGCSISTPAYRLLSDAKTYVMHSGSGGTPIFMSSLIDYRPTKIFQQWCLFWPNREARLEVAKFLSRARCHNFLEIKKTMPQYEIIKDANINDIVNTFLYGIEKSTNVNELRGYEGDFAKGLYVSLANSCNFKWIKRDNSRDRKNKDTVNKLVDDANYLVYGISGLSLFLMGLVPQLAVMHGATRSGGLVFDISDVFKDSIVLTCAFKCYQNGMSPGSEYRKTVVDWCDKNKLLNRHIEIIKQATDIGSSFLSSQELTLLKEDIFYDGELNQEVNELIAYSVDE